MHAAIQLFEDEGEAESSKGGTVKSVSDIPRLQRSLKETNPNPYSINVRDVLPEAAVLLEIEVSAKTLERKAPIAPRVSYSKKKLKTPLDSTPALPCGFPGDNKLCINVSGAHYVLWESVVRQQPGTMLASNHFRTYWDNRYEEYFIDRNREMFECVFKFYKTGELLFPGDLPEEVILDEVAFYWLENIFNTEEEDEGSLGTPRPDFPDTLRGKVDNVRNWTWLTLTQPKFNRLATLYAWCDQLFIFVAVCGMIVETLPVVKENIDEENFLASIEGATLFYAELCTTCFFTLDVILRFATAQDPKQLLKSAMTWIDVMSVLPFYIQHTLSISKNNIAGLRVIRLARVFRMFKLFRRSKKLALIALSLKRSASELLLFVLVWGLGVIIFSVLMYYAEGNKNEGMNSILATCWWAVATMSTVGYGDVYPITPIGQVIGSVVSFLSMIFLAMPLTIIVSSFSKTYKDSKKGGCRQQPESNGLG